MELENVIAKVSEVVSESCGIDLDQITPRTTLFDELGISSIDLVDILFTLEMEYDISLKISDLEDESREELQGQPFEIDNVITDAGLEVLRKKLPEISPDLIVKGLTVYEIINIITVETLANMIILKTSKSE